MKKVFVFILIICFLITGCSTTGTYKEVFKEEPFCNSKEFFIPKQILYRKTIKAICSRNFIIEEDNVDKGFILAKRFFQKGKRTIILLLQAKIIADDESKSILYLNAVQTTQKAYVADRTRFFLWVVPLPGGGGKEASKITEREVIIKDEKFYQNFFSAIGKEIEIASKKINRKQEDDKADLEEKEIKNDETKLDKAEIKEGEDEFKEEKIEESRDKQEEEAREKDNDIPLEDEGR
ncbi:MAG: hypothetical protein KAS99_00930 [Candidatus Omnitrophica bacterium]|nr:hypothetical protein [Candidatus Omnitrophota bacterium]